MWNHSTTLLELFVETGPYTRFRPQSETNEPTSLNDTSRLHILHGVCSHQSLEHWDRTSWREDVRSEILTSSHHTKHPSHRTPFCPGTVGLRTPPTTSLLVYWLEKLVWDLTVLTIPEVDPTDLGCYFGLNRVSESRERRECNSNQRSLGKSDLS